MSSRGPPAAIALALAYSIVSFLATVIAFFTTVRLVPLSSSAQVAVSAIAAPFALLVPLAIEVYRKNRGALTTTVLAFHGALMGVIFVLGHDPSVAQILMFTVPPLLTFGLAMIGAALELYEAPVSLDAYLLALGTTALLVIGGGWYLFEAFKPTRNPYSWMIFPLGLAITVAWTARWLWGRGRRNGSDA